MNFARPKNAHSTCTCRLLQWYASTKIISALRRRTQTDPTSPYRMHLGGQPRPKQSKTEGPLTKQQPRAFFCFQRWGCGSVKASQGSYTIRTHTHACICIYIYICTYKYVKTCVFRYTYTYTYMRTCVRTNIHTCEIPCINTCTCTEKRRAYVRVYASMELCICMIRQGLCPFARLCMHMCFCMCIQVEVSA